MPHFLVQFLMVFIGTFIHYLVGEQFNLNMVRLLTRPQFQNASTATLNSNVFSRVRFSELNSGTLRKSRQWKLCCFFELKNVKTITKINLF